jgi:hypothetical protein
MVQSEEELDDTGTSPVKKKDAEMTDRDSSEAGAKRRLSLGFSIQYLKKWMKVHC